MYLVYKLFVLSYDYTKEKINDCQYSFSFPYGMRRGVQKKRRFSNTQRKKSTEMEDVGKCHKDQWRDD